jgi:hypothetical protein
MGPQPFGCKAGSLSALTRIFDGFGGVGRVSIRPKEESDHASSQFTGTIAGLNSVAPFDTIDLADIAFGANTTVVYLASSTNAGTLTVSDGTHTANIALSGQYSPTSFKIASDGHGAVVDPLLSTSGSWSGVFSWPVIGIQSLLTPDGKILSYGTDQAGNQGALIYDVSDPTTNTHNTLPNQTHTDEFCGACGDHPGDRRRGPSRWRRLAPARASQYRRPGHQHF